MTVTRYINGDGTETFHGLPVTVPVGLVPADETPCEVRSYAIPFVTRWVSKNCGVAEPSPIIASEGNLAIMLADKPNPPEWIPPASLGDGEYTFGTCGLRRERPLFWLGSPAGVLRDWTDPPCLGRWQVENGKATYLGPIQ